jgi:hypothetical protein
MPEQITLSFTIASTDYSVPLGMRVNLDGAVFYETAHVGSETQIQHQLLDDDGEHELTFEMFGKQPEHTKIDNAGNIVLDAMLSVLGIEIDGIDINQIAQFQAIYHHDFNGTQVPIENKFYGLLGCNGIVRLKFTTPIYLWLLENM